MRVAVRELGFTSAAEAFVSGNQFAALAHDTLTGKLGGYAAMAGDDSTSTEFAAAYDEAAAACVDALAELVAGFAALGELTEATLANHARAEARSVISGGAVYVDGRGSLTGDSVAVLPATPPSALGGDSSALPGWANVVWDLIQGVVWPNADTDRLRAAAATWRDAAAAVDVLTGHCDTALAGFDEERSPEVPLAVATTQDLRARIRDLAAQFAGLGSACETYADQVDAKREEMLALLEGLARDAVIGAIVAGGLAIVSGGLSTLAAGGAGSARLAVAARDLQAVVDVLRVLAGGTARSLRPVATTARDTRSYLSRLTASRLAARTERGSIAVGRSSRWGRGWLADHEHSGSHTLRKHVGKTDEELLARIRNEDRRLASSFYDQDIAEAALETALSRNRSEIAAWLNDGRLRLELDTTLDNFVGRTAHKSGEIIDVRTVRTVLQRDAGMPDGYRIFTAYPKP